MPAGVNDRLERTIVIPAPIRMNTSHKKFIALIASFLGVTVGVGIFALPFAYSGSFPLGVLFLVGVGLLNSIMYTFYADILLEKGIGRHQLPGITGKIWGTRAKHLAGICLIISRYGSLIMYTLILGTFGSLIVRNLADVEAPAVLISCIMVVLVSLALAQQARIRNRVNITLSSVKIAILGAISTGAILLMLRNNPGQVTETLSISAQPGDPHFLEHLGRMWGVTVGALGGSAAIPAMKEITDSRKLILVSTWTGIAIAVLLYALFSFFVITTSGTVSQDALSGLGSSWWVTFLAIAGFIGISTAFIGIGHSLMEIFSLDYRIPRSLSLALTTAPPLVLVLAGFSDFATTAAVIGGTIGASEGIAILANHWKFRAGTARHTVLVRLATVVSVLILLIGFAISW